MFADLVFLEFQEQGNVLGPNIFHGWNYTTDNDIIRGMTRKNTLKMTLITGLVFLAFGGWLLHTRTHPPLADADNLIPFISGLISVIVLPAMFWFRPTLPYAYVINGMLVILGTITMAHFSIVRFGMPTSLNGLLFGSLLPDIAMLWGKFAVGKAIFDLDILKDDKDIQPKGRYFRYPNTGWWLVHLLAWSAVYAAGNLLWK